MQLFQDAFSRRRLARHAARPGNHTLTMLSDTPTPSRAGVFINRELDAENILAIFLSSVVSVIATLRVNEPTTQMELSMQREIRSRTQKETRITRHLRATKLGLRWLSARYYLFDPPEYHEDDYGSDREDEREVESKRPTLISFAISR